MVSIRELVQLKNAQINATKVLINSIATTKNREDLIRVGVAIRYGGNPNTYVNVPGVAQGFHLLGYVYLISEGQDVALFNTLFLIMIAGGASLGNPAYKEDLNSKEKVQSIGEWLESEGYNLIENYREGYQKKVPPSTLDFVNTILDRPQQVKNADPELIAKSYCQKMLSKYKQTRRMAIWDSYDMVMAVKLLNAPLFQFLLSKGDFPTYPMINTILLLAKEKKTKNAEEMSVIIEMIELMVKVGIEMDEYQLDILNVIDEKIHDKIINIGEAPYWRKVCQIRTINNEKSDETIKINPIQKEVPLRLKRTAKTLDINDESLQGICKSLDNASKTKKEQLSTALKKRRNDEFQSRNRYPNELIGDPQKILTCHNSQKGINKTFGEYSDIHASSYRDGDGNVWCFTSDYYPSLVEDQKNPHNGQKLPTDFVKELSVKLDILRDLGFKITDKPPTIDQAIDEIWEDDQLGAKIVDEEGIILKIGFANPERLTPEKADMSFKQIGIESNLKYLTGIHARVTSLWILNWLFDNRPDDFRIWRKYFESNN